jgi:hypothetical protein
MPCFPIASLATSGIAVHKNWIAASCLKRRQSRVPMAKITHAQQAGRQLFSHFQIWGPQILTTVHDVLPAESIRITGHCVPFFRPAALAVERTNARRWKWALSLLQFGDSLHNHEDHGAASPSNDRETESFFTNEQIFYSFKNVSLTDDTCLARCTDGIEWTRYVHSPQQLALCRTAPHTKPPSAQKGKVGSCIPRCRNDDNACCPEQLEVFATLLYRLNVQLYIWTASRCRLLRTCQRFSSLSWRWCTCLHVL